MLEIPRPATTLSTDSSKQVDFRTYSSKEIIPTFFTEKFAEFFDFTQVDNITIVNYFEKQVACWTCLNVRDIKSAIKRLKYIAKHKNLRAKQSTIEQSLTQPDQPTQSPQPHSVGIISVKPQRTEIADTNVAHQASVYVTL